MATKIKSVKVKVGRKYHILPDNELNVSNIEIKLSNGAHFDINLDDDGDVLIVSQGICKVVCEENNVVAIRVKKKC